MEIKTTSPVSIVKGYGELFFPEVFRTDCYLSSVNCVSLSLKSKRPAASDSLILTCNGSHYVDADNTRKPNVLALFEEKKGVVQFNDLHLPLTSPPEILEIYISNAAGQRQDVVATGLLEIRGITQNKFMT